MTFNWPKGTLFCEFIILIIAQRHKEMLSKKLDIAEIERKWQKVWKKEGVFAWDPNKQREDNFVIDTPPPTISGTLHMGHISSYTHTDFIARYQRMRGKNVFYPMGVDNNGLPTERLVEKMKKVKGTKMLRKEFVNLCREVVPPIVDQYINLFTSIGLSVDWSQTYETISDQSCKLSQMSFIDLYNKGKIERKQAPSFWDPVDRTAISQAEMEDHTEASTMNYISFDTGKGGPIVIATTRPEMLPACVAVLYHPSDSRYSKLEGGKAITPLFNAEVPLIADEDVDMEKGTGLVMCCTFGDMQDILWWRKHMLPTKNILDSGGKIEGVKGYEGLKIDEARSRVLYNMKKIQALVKQEKITHSVKCAERSKAPLEIKITNQWYIKVLSEKESFLKEAKKLKWYPEYMGVRLEQWIKGLNQEWCISRQRFFGVPIPAWYSKRPEEKGKVILPTIDQLPVDPSVDLPKGYSAEEVEGDLDVMDTWATSAISPQLSSLALNKEYALNWTKHKKLYPADLRPQGHEIIRTWAFGTMVKSLYHDKKLPWKQLAISGWCLDKNKQKMSKSKGNVVAPTGLIEQHGADAVRYWASSCKLGADSIYSEDKLKIAKKLINKLWNASKFAVMHFPKMEHRKPLRGVKGDIQSGYISHTMDIWLLSKLFVTIELCTAAFDRFEYCDARTAVENFFWNDLCANYLEIIKKRIYNDDEEDRAGQQSSIRTLYYTMDAVLRLFAPIIPHITEEIHNSIYGKKTIQDVGSWPTIEHYSYDHSVMQEGDEGIQILELVRQWKSSNYVPDTPINRPIDKVECYGVHISSNSLIKDICNASVANILQAKGDIQKLKEKKSSIISRGGKCAIVVRE